MSDDDIRRDIDEEDELRRLLHRPSRPAIPPFTSVAERAAGARPSLVRVVSALVAIVAVVVAVAALARPSSVPLVTSSSSPSATFASAPSGPAASRGDCLPSYLALARDSQTGLVTSLVTVELSDRSTNQMQWTITFLSSPDAIGPASVVVHATITGPNNTPLLVLGYDQPPQQTLKDGDVLTIAPCSRAGFVVRTAGPLLDGNWPYVVTIDKVTLADGRTVSQTLSVTLSCDNKSWTCGQVLPGGQLPTPTPNMAVLKPSFGIIYWGTATGYGPGLAPKIRREGETSTLGELAPNYFNQFHGAVSPSGRLAAYPSQIASGAWSLYLLDGSKPTEQRKLLDLPGEIPTQIMWASDESAIAFTVEDANAVQGVPPKYDAVRTLDLATGKVSELDRIDTGRYYRLVGWNKRSATIAYITPNDGNGIYTVWTPSGARGVPLDGPWGALASADARTVMGFRCDAQNQNCVAASWPLGNFSARTDQQLGADLSVAPIAWRPGTDEIALMVGTVAPSPAHQLIPDHVELWSPTKGRRTIYTFVDGRTPPGPCFFRADGSAFVITGYGEATVVDLATGATSPLPFPAPTGPWDKPFPAASIRLGAP